MDRHRRLYPPKTGSTMFAYFRDSTLAVRSLAIASGNRAMSNFLHSKPVCHLSHCRTGITRYSSV
jgi:hypothetical protein